MCLVFVVRRCFFLLMRLRLFGSCVVFLLVWISSRCWRWFLVSLRRFI